MMMSHLNSEYIFITHWTGIVIGLRFVIKLIEASWTFVNSTIEDLVHLNWMMVHIHLPLFAKGNFKNAIDFHKSSMDSTFDGGLGYDKASQGILH